MPSEEGLARRPSRCAAKYVVEVVSYGVVLGEVWALGHGDLDLIPRRGWLGERLLEGLLAPGPGEEIHLALLAQDVVRVAQGRALPGGAAAPQEEDGRTGADRGQGPALSHFTDGGHGVLRLAVRMKLKAPSG